MSEQVVTKEVIIRGILTSLIDVPGAPAIDPGALVLFLEREASEWFVDHVVALDPLWEFCVQRWGWSEEHFQQLFVALQQLFANQPVQWNLPSAVFAQGATAPAEVSPPEMGQPASHVAAPPLASGFAVEATAPPLQPATPAEATPAEVFAQQRRTIINWIVSGLRNSPAQRVIDPSKLRQFLLDSLEDLWENDALQLGYLWEIMTEPEVVTADMAVGAFLIMEYEKPEEVTIDLVWPEFMSGLSVSQRLSFFKSMGIEPPASLLQYQTGSMQLPATGSHMSFGSLQAPAQSGSRTMSGMGQQAGTQGYQTGSYTRKRITSARKVQPEDKKKEKKKKKKPTRSSGRRGKPDLKPKSLHVPIWAVVLLGLVVAGGLSYYFLFVPANLEGQPMNVSAYSRFLPLQDLRVQASTVKVMPKKGFFLNSDDVQSSKIKVLYEQIKQNNSYIMKMAIYSTRGKFLRYYQPSETADSSASNNNSPSSR